MKALQTKGARFCANTEIVILRHVVSGILPYVKATSLRLDAHLATSANFDMLRQMRSPAKSQRKLVRKDQLLYWRSLYNWVVYLKVLIRENLLCHVNKEDWGQNTPSNFPRARGTKKKIGKERVHREVLSQSVRLMSVVFARRNSRKDHMRKPWTQNDAPAGRKRLPTGLFVVELRILKKGGGLGGSVELVLEREEGRGGREWGKGYFLFFVCTPAALLTKNVNLFFLGGGGRGAGALVFWWAPVPFCVLLMWRWNQTLWRLREARGNIFRHESPVPNTTKHKPPQSIWPCVSLSHTCRNGNMASPESSLSVHGSPSGSYKCWRCRK